MGATKAKGILVLQNGYTTVVSTVSSDSFRHKFTHIVKSAVPFIIFLLFYFSNKILCILPGLEDLGCVHIYTINAIEEFLFGCQPHRFVSMYHYPVLDFLAAIPYLIHYIIPMVMPLYLLLRGCIDEIGRFYWLLGWVMWVHYLFWMVFPHTPPWVLDNIAHNNATTLSASMQHREGCAFARLDKLTGVPFFYNMFIGNPIPYASFPSGHVTWATVSYFNAPPNDTIFAFYIGYVAWATLYSCHHYVSDVLGALLVVTLTKRVLSYLHEKQVCSSSYRCRSISIACPFPV